MSSQCFPREYPKATVPGEFEHDRFFSFVIARGPGSNLLRVPANLSVTVTEPDEFCLCSSGQKGKKRKHILVSDMKKVLGHRWEVEAREDVLWNSLT